MDCGAACEAVVPPGCSCGKNTGVKNTAGVGKCMLYHDIVRHIMLYLLKLIVKLKLPSGC